MSCCLRPDSQVPSHVQYSPAPLQLLTQHPAKQFTTSSQLMDRPARASDRSVRRHCLAFPPSCCHSLIGRILSSSKLTARPQCLMRLQSLLAFRSLFVVPRCFEAGLVSLSHLSEVVSSFHFRQRVASDESRRLIAPLLPVQSRDGFKNPCVQRGQKQKKGHDKLLFHGHSSMARGSTRFRAKSVPEF